MILDYLSLATWLQIWNIADKNGNDRIIKEVFEDEDGALVIQNFIKQGISRQINNDFGKSIISDIFIPVSYRQDRKRFEFRKQLVKW